MTEKMDAGPILKQVVVAIKDGETAVELDERLAIESAGVVQGILDDIEKGTMRPIVQDESNVTFAPKFKKTDGEINWSGPAQGIINRIRAMHPWPGTYTYYNPAGKEPVKVDVLDACLCKGCGNTLTVSKAGDIIEITNNELIISCGQRERLSIISIKPAGGRVLTVREFINGYRLKIGDKLGKEAE